MSLCLLKRLPTDIVQYVNDFSLKWIMQHEKKFQPTLSLIQALGVHFETFVRCGVGAQLRATNDHRIWNLVTVNSPQGYWKNAGHFLLENSPRTTFHSPPLPRTIWDSLVHHNAEFRMLGLLL